MLDTPVIVVYYSTITVCIPPPVLSREGSAERGPITLEPAWAATVPTEEARPPITALRAIGSPADTGRQGSSENHIKEAMPMQQDKEWDALLRAIYAPRSRGRIKRIRQTFEAYQEARRPWWRRWRKK